MKRAISFFFEGHNDTTITQFRKEIVERAQQHAMSRGLSVHSKEYNFDTPEEVKLFLGGLVFFATGQKLGNGSNMGMPEEVEQTVGIRQWLKPIVKDVLKEVWYGKNKPPEKVEATA